MLNKEQKNNTKILHKPWRIYTVISVVGLIFILLMLNGFQKAVHLVEEHSSLFNALSNVESEINNSNIWYEEIFSDKNVNQIKQAEKHIDKALRFINTLSKKDTVNGVVYSPHNGNILSIGLKSIKFELEKIKSVGEKYFAIKKETDNSTKIPLELNYLMSEVSKSVGDVIASARTNTINELHRFELLRVIIITLFFIFQLLLLFSVYKYNKNRKEDYLTIKDSYNKLQKTNANLEIAERLIKENEKRYKTLVSKSPIGIHELDGNGNFISINNAEIKLRKIPNTEEIINTSYFDFVSAVDKERIKEIFNSVLNGEASEFEYISKNIGDTEQIISAAFIPLIEEDGTVNKVMGVTQDITDIITYRKKLKNANLLYAILSEINKAIVRIDNTHDLYDKICKIFVEYGKFKSTWVGLANFSENNFKPVAFFGNFDTKYLKNVTFSLKDEKYSNLTVIKKLMDKEIVIFNNIKNDPDYPFWREEALKSGFVSGAVVPIIMHCEVIGVLSIGSANLNFFGKKEHDLLKEISLDISFALEKIDSDIKRRHAESAIQNIEKGISSAVGTQFFDSIVKSLNETVGAYSSFISEYNIESDNIKLLSFFGDKKLERGKVYNLKGTPANQVISEGKYLVNGNLSTTFPEDKLLKEMKIESYFGLRLVDSNNKIIGILVSLFTEKVKDEEFINSIYNIFSSRVSAELERKYTFDSLLASERRYQKLYEQSNDAIYLLYNNKFEFINKKFTELFGYTFEQVNSDDFDFIQIVSPKSLPVINERIKRSLAGEKLSPIYEFTALTNSGKEVECETSVTQLDYKDGCATQGIIRDVTARKLAIEEIKNSEKSYRELFDNSDDAIYILDREGKFISVNQGVVEMYGYPREYFIGKTPGFLSAPGKNNLDAVRTMVSKAWDGEPQNFEYWGLRKNGEVFPKEVRLRKGSYWGEEVMIAFSRNITEKKIKDELISMSELRYRSLFESSADSILLLQNNKFVDCNPRALTMFGCSRDQIIGKSSEQFYPVYQRDGSISIDNINKIFEKCEQGENQNFEWEFSKYEGSNFTADVNLSRIKLFGDVLILAIIRDLSAKKKAERELTLASEKAKSSDKLKSEFLAQMSHEIRTPINTILSFSSLIKDELENKVSSDLKESFVGIENAGMRIIRTIDLIINMSELQANSYDYRPKVIDLETDIFSKLEAEYNNIAYEKGIDLVFSHMEISPTIFADEYTVNQIFKNLIDNAIKYTAKGEVKLSYTTNNSFIEIKVEDTGIGIAEEYLLKLFDVFSQEEQGYTRSFEGVGLGMAVVKKYCEMNNAEIKVESKKGKGTIFSVIFELSKEL